MLSNDSFKQLNQVAKVLLILTSWRHMSYVPSIFSNSTSSGYRFMSNNLLQLHVLAYLRWGQKGSPTSFSQVTSANVGIRPENFLTFSFNPFVALV